MQNFARRLMSGASLAMLAVAGLPGGTARAAGGITVAGVTSHVTVPFPNQEDYILVTAGGDVTGNVLNQGFVGFPTNPGYGVEVQGTALHHAVIGGNITNEGVIHGSSSHHAEGIYINGADATLNGNIYNQHTGDIIANAATATSAGVAAIDIANGAHFNGHIVNSGQIHVGATVVSSDARIAGIYIDSPSGRVGRTDYNQAGAIIDVKAVGHGARANAIGYDLSVHGNVSAAFDNHGMIAVTASQAGGHGVADATGAYIHNSGAVANANEVEHINNYGTIQVEAIAKGPTGLAGASAYGADLTARGAGGASNHAYAEAYNGGLIAVDAHVTAIAGHAYAVGAYEGAFHAHHVSAYFQNARTVDASALMKNAAGSRARASAVGVEMTASTASIANNRLYNTGEIVAHAKATAVHHATAKATGVYQNMNGFASGHNSVTNYNLISASAKATAINPHADAHGVVQTESSNFSFENKLYNAGEIHGVAHAKDVGGSGYAAATGVGLVGAGTLKLKCRSSCGSPVAIVGGDPSNHITNNAIMIQTATASAVFASARAVAAKEKLSGVGVALNAVTNHGLIGAFADAKGHYASAHATGVAQFATTVTSHATNTVKNYKTIVGHATAKATATVSARAYADAYGVHQDADRMSTVAHNIVSNRGHIVGASTFVPAIIDARATAVGARTADARAIAVDQSAQYAALNLEENAVYNSGTIEAHAQITGKYGYASALGVDQYIYNSVADGVAHGTNKVTNLGVIQAHAYANGRSERAEAYGVNQYIGHATTAGNIVHSTDTVVAFASAKGVNPDAYAYAVRQHLYQNDFAKNSAVNSGLIEAAATAHGNHNGYASAYAVSQTGSYATTAKNIVANYGHIEAFATGKGTSYAAAEAYGVYQRFHNATAALNSVANRDVITAQAKAVGTHSDGYATAKAVQQSAYYVSDATNVVRNSGMIGALASATNHYADAYAIGVTQRAHNVTAANNVVHNSGHIVATAHALGGSAYGEAYGVYQSLYSIGLTAKNYVSNTSDAVIQAKAVAHGTANDGRAYAYGVQQYVSDTPKFATNSVVNYGHIVASASAHGHNYAYAEGYGVNQYADATANASNYVKNSGVIAASAKAVSTSGEAFATAEGVYQSAYANASANNRVYNTSTIQAFAHATGKTHVRATADGIYQRGRNATTVSNVVTNYGAITAFAGARGKLNNVSASAFGVFQTVESAAYAFNSVSNHGVIRGTASAHGSNYASAQAWGVSQQAHGNVSATNQVFNDGQIFGVAKAYSLHSDAYAEGYGVQQYAHASVAASNLVGNSGTIAGSARASGKAYASANANGVSQVAYATKDAYNSVTNGGYITAKAIANASDARANVVGVHQRASANTSAANLVTNDGHIYALASANGGDTGNAYASGVYQYAQASHAFNQVHNAGYITANAFAAGVSRAYAGASGVDQYASGDVNGATALHLAAGNSVTNTHRITAKATAYATSGSVATARATAYAAGVYQNVYGGAAGNIVGDKVINHGDIYANARAIATSATHATAKATAMGVDQKFTVASGTMLAEVHNTGVIEGYASASASGVIEKAVASGAGVVIHGSALKLAVDVQNSHGIYGDAYAYASHATAQAIGVGIKDTLSNGVVVGTVLNHGVITADAYAPGGVAHAVGVGVQAYKFTGEIENTDFVGAYAYGKTATAVAVGVTNNGFSAGVGTGLIVNNGGEIYAENNSKAGWAINVVNAPNKININLEGAGSVYGNIGIQSVDTIAVVNGKTYFDGIVNPGAIGKVGAFNVDAGATLSLARAGSGANSSDWGTNARLNVNSYSQPGTLQLNVDAVNTGGASLAGGTGLHNGQIYANSANITGGAVVVDPGIGLYPNKITYQVVFASGGPAIGGSNQWATPITFYAGGAINPSSPLFALAEVNPSVNEADITLTRTAFNAVTGLTPNENGVGTGLEGGYSLSLVGAPAAFYQSLFLLSSAQYTKALDMLSGEEAGEIAMVNANSARDFMDMLSAHVGGFESAAGMMASLSQPAPVQLAALGDVTLPASGAAVDPALWGSGFGSWSNLKSTVSGPGLNTNHGGVSAGWDIYSDSQFMGGLAIAYSPKSNVRFESFASPLPATGSVEGFNVGAYGRYNAPEGYYLAGNFAYGSYDDTTNRFVSLPLLGSGWLSGKFTSSVWSVYGEGGYPMDWGAGTKFTPYLAIAYINSDSGSYTESGHLSGGSTVANLSVSDASSTSVSTYLGAQIATQWGMDGGSTLLPSLRVAWAHEFESDIWNVNASFSGIPGSAFGPVTGGALAKDSAMVDADLGMALSDDVKASIGYEGRFNDSLTSHFLFGRLDFTLP